MRFGGQNRDEILYDEVSLLTKQGPRPLHQTVHRPTRDKIAGIFSIEVEGQRARNHEPLPEAVHRSWGAIAKVAADPSNPFSYNPETASRLGYPGDVKICARSEPLQRWVKC